MASTASVHFAASLEEGLADLSPHLPFARALLITGPSRRFTEHLPQEFMARVVAQFDGATVHVPEEVVAAAEKQFVESKADAIVSLGGGAATGLAKALRLQHPDTPHLAIPTTFAGSEATSIYGILKDGEKKTGRDQRIKPDFVLYCDEVFRGLPTATALASVLNAMAHPFSALTTGQLAGEERSQAAAVLRDLDQQLANMAYHPEGGWSPRTLAKTVFRAGQVLDRGPMGDHHSLVHWLGGKFALPHAQLHALVLPHSYGSWAAPQGADVRGMRQLLKRVDPAADWYDLLRLVELPRSLRSLGVSPGDFELALEDAPHDRDLLHRIFVGARPSRFVVRGKASGDNSLVYAGASLDSCKSVVLALHGRGGSAETTAAELWAMCGHNPGLAVVALQSKYGHWYQARYSVPREQIGRELVASLELVTRVAEEIRNTTAAPLDLYGFSQGGCLALEAAALHPGLFRRVVAYAACRVGLSSEWDAKPRDPTVLPEVQLGGATRDGWVGFQDVEATVQWFARVGYQVRVAHHDSDQHIVSLGQRVALQEFLCQSGRDAGLGQGGFGANHSSESLPGALPRRQNSPRQGPYGLYPEQLNVAGFTTPREKNRRSWLYRMRPGASNQASERLEHATFMTPSAELQNPDLRGFPPLPIPKKATDFVEGLHCFGGAGSPQLRRGYAIHLYAANRHMHERCFSNADGDMLLIPELGGLNLVTELGCLDVEPGQIAIVPRGIRFSVLLKEEAARGYIGEVYGQGFELPERGPIGANGLADARHFRSPRAWHESPPCGRFRITTKTGGHLFEATTPHSPFDVVAWHGNCCPYVYDLFDFSPVIAGRFDHPDPSVNTVLSAPLDESGAHCLDFVAFVPRWDVSEQTFRPPFFHRNAVTEFNGIIRETPRENSPFRSGMFFLTPSCTPHGVMNSSVERALWQDDDADAPSRSSASSLWFQFESILPLQLSSWALQHCPTHPDWLARWGSYRSHFCPKGEPYR